MVFCKFPKKFPINGDGFLYLERGIAPRKQETFVVLLALTLTLKCFLDRKRFPPQETFDFLQGFLGNVKKCR